MRGLAFISNGMGSALVDDDMSVVWLALPRFDSPPIFSSILDRRIGGGMRISFGALDLGGLSREYVGNSLMLLHRASAGNGGVKVLDVMPLSEPAFMRYIKSDVEFEVEVDPRFEYGMINPEYELKDGGTVFKDPRNSSGVELKLEWSSWATREGPRRWRLRPGWGHMLLLYSMDLGYGLFSGKGEVYSVPHEVIGSTVDYWRANLSQVRVRPPEWAWRAFYSSLMAALGLIYRPSGGAVAAPTTSLPESVGSNRNWDYRYVWVRDASLAAEALIRVGLVVRGRGVLDFLLNVLDPSRKPFNYTLYSVDGGPPPSERELGWLSGYRGSRPVRVGNAAHRQLQLDIEGEFMSALKVYYDATGDSKYVSNNWWAVESVASYCSSNYRRGDAGIWEDRGEPKHYVHSKVMMWYAVKAASDLAAVVGAKGRAGEWRARADEMRDWILDNAWNGSVGSFVGYYGSEHVDASLLVMPLYGFIDAGDEMFRATLRRIEEELVAQDLVFRYRRDFLGKAAYPFGLASSWLARVYLRSGRPGDALRIVRRLASCANDLGLLGEHIDPRTCEARGNFPQLYTHIGLLNAIAELVDVQAMG